MQGKHLFLTFNAPGQLSANTFFHFKAPFDMILEKVSAICDASDSFILDIGTTADTDAYLDGVTVTGSATAATEYDEDDFVNGDHPRIAAGTDVAINVDYDGGAGGDAANVCIVLTLAEG